jgi:hypothetical protein
MRRPQRTDWPAARTDDPSTWIKFSLKMCRDCSASCCSLPVEVTASDLVRMGLMAECERDGDLRPVARRLARQRLIEHYHHRTRVFTLARMANGDCCFLQPGSRLCSIYQQRPDTCRNHPQVGPRSGYCAYTPKKVIAGAPPPPSVNRHPPRPE